MAKYLCLVVFVYFPNFSLPLKMVLLKYFFTFFCFTLKNESSLVIDDFVIVLVGDLGGDTEDFDGGEDLRTCSSSVSSSLTLTFLFLFSGMDCFNLTN